MTLPLDTDSYLLVLTGIAAESGVPTFRPDVVWFGETIARESLDRIEAFVAAAGARLRYLAVGTSGLVYPAAGLVDAVRSTGGKSWLVNLEPPSNATRFDEVVIGPAGTALPALFAA